jgi:hypothetical protein
MSPSSDEGATLFREKREASRRLQQFVWGLVVLVLGGSLLLDPADWAVGFWGAVVLALMALWMRLSSLTTEVRAEGVVVRLAPFRPRFYAREEVADWHVHMAFPWPRPAFGFRAIPRLTVWQGGEGPGLTLNLADGQTVWIGSDRPIELDEALRTMARPAKGTRRRRSA